MKRWSIIIAAALVAIWLVVDTARETIQYFSSEPHRLLYVAVIALVGGFAALCFARLSPSMLRRVRVFAWGAAASISTVFIGYFAFRLISLSSLLVKSGGSVWVVLMLLFFSGIAIYLWFEFYREWKKIVLR